MKIPYKYWILIAALLGILIMWLINMDIIGVEKNTPHQTTALELAGNACVAISEKSVSHMVAVVDFQKLEITGRKARVMQNCMNDHGYVQNNAWANYATPIAQQMAKTNHVSFDEAFENLRRVKMLVFTPETNTPLFWMSQKH